MMNLLMLLLNLRLVPSILNSNLMLHIFIMSSRLLCYMSTKELKSRLELIGSILGIEFPNNSFRSFILLDRLPNSRPFRWMELKLLLCLRSLLLFIPIIPLFLLLNLIAWIESKLWKLVFLLFPPFYQLTIRLNVISFSPWKTLKKPYLIWPMIKPLG